MSAVVLDTTVDKCMLIRHAAYSDKLDDGYDERLVKVDFTVESNQALSMLPTMITKDNFVLPYS